MRRPSTKLSILSSLLAINLAAAGCVTSDWGAPKSKQTPGQIAFSETVRPLIEQRCVWCHSNKLTQGSLNFQQRGQIFDPDFSYIVPGKPEISRIWIALTRDGAHPKAMPGDGWGISDEQENAIKLWIEEGAPWPEGRAGNIKRRPYRVELDDYL